MYIKHNVNKDKWSKKKKPKTKTKPTSLFKICLWQQMWLKGLPSYMYIRIIIVYMQNIKMTMRLSCYPSDYMHVLIHTYCVYIYIIYTYIYYIVYAAWNNTLFNILLLNQIITSTGVISITVNL